MLPATFPKPTLLLALFTALLLSGCGPGDRLVRKWQLERWETQEPLSPSAQLMVNAVIHKIYLEFRPDSTYSSNFTMLLGEPSVVTGSWSLLDDGVSLELRPETGNPAPVELQVEELADYLLVLKTEDGQGRMYFHPSED